MCFSIQSSSALPSEKSWIRPWSQTTSKRWLSVCQLCSEACRWSKYLDTVPLLFSRSHGTVLTLLAVLAHCSCHTWHCIELGGSYTHQMNLYDSRLCQSQTTFKRWRSVFQLCSEACRWSGYSPATTLTITPWSHCCRGSSSSCAPKCERRWLSTYCSSTFTTLK